MIDCCFVSLSGFSALLDHQPITPTAERPIKVDDFQNIQKIPECSLDLQATLGMVRLNMTALTLMLIVVTKLKICGYILLTEGTVAIIMIVHGNYFCIPVC